MRLVTAEPLVDPRAANNEFEDGVEPPLRPRVTIRHSLPRKRPVLAKADIHARLVKWLKLVGSRRRRYHD